MRLKERRWTAPTRLRMLCCSAGDTSARKPTRNSPGIAGGAETAAACCARAGAPRAAPPRTAETRTAVASARKRRKWWLQRARVIVGTSAPHTAYAFTVVVRQGIAPRVRVIVRTRDTGRAARAPLDR